MKIEIHNPALAAELLKLPRNSEIRQPDGMWRRLTENEWESANKTDTIYGDVLPFWILGWRDLHERLRLAIDDDDE